MGGPGSGRKKEPSSQLRCAIEGINVTKIVKNLEKWSEGKEVICPHCMERTGVFVPDTVALQSGIELLNRRLGKPVQRTELDITERIELSADQIDGLLQRNFGISIGDVQAYVQRLALPSGQDSKSDALEHDGGNIDSQGNHL